MATELTLAEIEALVAWLRKAKSAIYIAVEETVAKDISGHLVQAADLIESLQRQLAVAVKREELATQLAWNAATERDAERERAEKAERERDIRIAEWRTATDYMERWQELHERAEARLAAERERGEAALIELQKIAESVGEASDPFAAWESIDALIKANQTYRDSYEEPCPGCGYLTQPRPADCPECDGYGRRPKAPAARLTDALKALEPFARAASEWDGEPDSLCVEFTAYEGRMSPNGCVADFRRALAIVESTKEGGGE